MASRRTRRPRLSDAEREQRRLAHRRQLTEAVEALLSSEGWQRWVGARARNGLGRYSLNNQLMIALQCPHASYVCGFRPWLELGYCVRKGERAIRILAPMKVRLADDDPAGGAGGEPDDERSRVFFRAVPVFDRSQVDPLPDREPTPLEPPREPITGDSHAHLIGPLDALAAELGYDVHERADTGAADGWCDPETHVIVANAALAANAKVRVRVHELAHALGIGYTD
jgi:antirestriction protein ArdC